MIDKKEFKLADKECRLCGNGNYAVLDVHRIRHGKDGGKYTEENSVTLCSNCHRKVHNGEIVLDRYYPSTSGKNLLRIIVDGVENYV